MKTKFKITVSGETLEEFEKNLNSIHESINGKKNKNISVKIENPIATKDLPKTGEVLNDPFTQNQSNSHAGMGKTASIKDVPVNQLYNQIAGAENKPPVPAQPYNPPAAAQPTNNNDLDKRGFPWDERIHASTKVKTAKGVWKSKRGVSDELVNNVENELRSKTSANFEQPKLSPEQVFNQQPQQPAQGGYYRGDSNNPPAPVQPQQHYQPPAAPVHQSQPQQPYNPPVQPQPVVNQPAPPPANDFGGLMTRISVLFSQSLVSAEYISELAMKIGQAFNSNVTAITDIAGNQAMVDYAIQNLQADGKWI